MEKRTAKNKGDGLMKDRQFHIYLDDEEFRQVLQALIALKNNLIAQGRYTDAVDDVLIKFTKARKKKDYRSIHLNCSYAACFFTEKQAAFCVFRAIFKGKNFLIFLEKGRFWVCILPPFVQMSEGVISSTGIFPLHSTLKN